MQHTINGGELHWREVGAGDPVLFIHGFPFDNTLWDPQLAAVPAGWRFDRAGFAWFRSNAADRQRATHNGRARR